MYFSGLWLEVLLYFFWTIFLYPSQVSVALQVPLRPLTNIVTSKQQQQRQTNTQARARAHTHTYTHTHAHTHTHSQSYTHSHTHTHTHTHTKEIWFFYSTQMVMSCRWSWQHRRGPARRAQEITGWCSSQPYALQGRLRRLCQSNRPTDVGSFPWWHYT